MKLLELFDQAFPWKWNVQDEDFYQAEFVESKGIPIHVQFQVEDPHWEVDFTRDSGPADKTLGITGEGDALKIFATVADVVKSFVRKVLPEELYFTADEPSRQKMYQRALPRLAKFIGMTISTSGSLYGQRPERFTLKRIEK